MHPVFSRVCLAALPCLGLAPCGSGPSDQIVTLWAQDDLRSSFSFLEGGPAAVVSDGQLFLDATQLAFGVFVADQISYGYVADEQALILDLGDLVVPPDPRPLDQAPKPSLSVYTTLFRDRIGLFYRGPNNRTFRLPSAETIFQTLPLGSRCFRPELRHVYLLRSRVPGEGGHDVLAKFQILGYQPGQSVTFRWALL